ncbi:rhomboid family intramembrane serine protease [Paludisphaera soli]|uniref:rhomboid family intramembrane serine protease n=1 Tax=Paludisphaera soli TaxID=2712865 RepID=UPI0013EAA35D|nr:rhomboid family intramembrane serine protease [Paludisphaera soli]
MRQIGELPKDLDPAVLEDHLLGLGVKSRFDRRPDGGWAVWIIDEDHVPRCREELAGYLAAPGDPKFRANAQAAREARKRQAKLDREFRKNDRDAGELWTAPTFRRRPVTAVLVAIAVVVFLLQNSLTQNRTEAYLAFLDAPILAGQVWRLITPIFLHFGLLHVAFNCWMMLLLGTPIEVRRGSGKFLAMVVGSAILSNFAEYFYLEHLRGDPDGAMNVVFGGLSGVNYALFGYVWMMGENHPEEGLRMDPTNTLILLGWLVFCMTGALGPVANMAHLSGLGVGMVLGMLKF